MFIPDIPGWSCFLFPIFGFLTLPPCYNIDKLYESFTKAAKSPEQLIHMCMSVDIVSFNQDSNN